MRILIVDDSASMRREVRLLLEGTARAIHECSNGSDALASYLENRPDWVFMDVRMEGVDGLEATRRIMAACPDARVVILTSYDDPELRDAARAAGACGYVLKEHLSLVPRIVSGDGSGSTSTI